jgi:hypothetical protein
VVVDAPLVRAQRIWRAAMRTVAGCSNTASSGTTR